MAHFMRPKFAYSPFVKQMFFHRLLHLPCDVYLDLPYLDNPPDGLDATEKLLASNLLQLDVLGLGDDKNGNVGVGVFPEREEILVGSFGFGGVALQSVRPRKPEMRQCADGRVQPGMIPYNLLARGLSVALYYARS